MNRSFRVPDPPGVPSRDREWCPPCVGLYRAHAVSGCDVGLLLFLDGGVDAGPTREPKASRTPSLPRDPPRDPPLYDCLRALVGAE